MTEYKGITREDSTDVWYWLDDYCQNKDPLVLENDIVLQSKVRKYYRWKMLKILFFNMGLWALVIYAVYEFIKG